MMLHKSFNGCALAMITAIFVAGVLSAQERERDYTFVEIEESIAQRAVSAIVQDKRGLIWMGTYSGLSKFNGLDLITYKHEYNNPKSLNSSLVQSLFLDSSDQLWVGTELGLNLYDKDLDIFDQVTFYKNGKALNSIVVTAIEETAPGRLLVGSRANGFFEVHVETMAGTAVFLKDFDASPMTINCFTRTETGTLFIGANNGLYEVDLNETRVFAPRKIVFGPNEDFNKNIESLLIDVDGHLWMGTHSNGIIKAVKKGNAVYEISVHDITNERIRTMVQAPDGSILCGTENDGLFVLERDGAVVRNYRNGKFILNSIASNSIWSLYVDKEHRIWMGYYNKGVAVYDRNYDKFKDIESLPHVENSLQSNSVTALIQDAQKKFWIGMDGGGIDVYDAVTEQFIHLLDPNNPIAVGLTAKDVQTLFLDSRGNIWVGTWNSGLFLLPKNQTIFQHWHVGNTNKGLKSNRVMSFSEDKQGTIWIGTFSDELHSYDHKTQRFRAIADSSLMNLKKEGAEIRKVLVDSRNLLWVATNSGIYKRKANSTDTFVKVKLESAFIDVGSPAVTADVIVSLYEDKDQHIWIGTDGAGVWKYDASDHSITWFNKEQGLQQETIAALMESNDGKLWMAGNKGLSFYNREKNHMVNYDIYDGLLTNNFNFNAAYKDGDGTLYFGNYKGINIVEPSALPINTNKPELYFTDFKVFNESVDLFQKDAPLQKVVAETAHIVLNHRQRVFTIEFMGINFTRPEKNQYAYYLEGLEDTWNYVGSTRSATYTNLSPGEYTFKVKAANNDGLWNNEVKTLQLSILAPWWKTNLALMVYLMAIVLLSSWIYGLFKARIKEKRTIQFERAKRIQEEELNDRKIQFFTNISHEFRTPLTLILNPMNDIMANPNINLPTAVQDKLGIVAKNAARLKRLIDELMDFRKLQLNKFSIKVSEMELNGFINEVSHHFVEEAKLKNIAFFVECERMPLPFWSDPGMLEKVIFNILSNAFKITPENGTITIGAFQCSNDHIFPLIDDEKSVPAVEIFIEDTGSGIDQEEVKRIFDRFYQVKNMNSQYYGGTGIGLEVVKSFVDLLKGKIIVESEEAVGTKFRLFFPLGNAHFNPDELLLKPSKESSSPERYPTEDALERELAKDSKRTLLIVEDNTELRAYLKHELSFDYIILEATNGEKGLEIANLKTPDLIITDVVMPEMDGFELTETLKRNIGTSHIPIIMLTAKTMLEDELSGVNAGADVYLSKPFDMRLLKSYLTRLIENRQVYINKNLNDPNKLNLLEKTTELDKSFMKRVLDHLNKNIEKSDLNVEHLADDMHLSRSQLYRKIKAMTGLTPNELIRRVRLEKAKLLIESGCESIGEVCFKVGFSSPSYFSRCFKSEFGILPTELKIK
jgi:signal transduction histidine kinase/ligand-binding sensor domain-containing protein/DNA-binding response OmpR family regulator